MTRDQQIAEQFKAEGKQKGIEQGIEQGKLEVAKQLLSEKIGLSDADLIALVKRLTGLSEDKIKELREKH